MIAINICPFGGGAFGGSMAAVAASGMAIAFAAAAAPNSLGPAFVGGKTPRYFFYRELTMSSTQYQMAILYYR
jgi:hypothetical protein